MNFSDDDDEFVDVLEQLPLPASEGGQQPHPIVLGKRTREPDDSDVSDISEKRVDRNQSSDGSVVEDDFVPTSLPLPSSPLACFSSSNKFSSLCDEVDPTTMDHDERGVYLYRERFVLANRNARMVFLLLWMILHISSPLLLRMTLRLSPPRSLVRPPVITNTLTYPKMDQNLAWLRKMILRIVTQLKFLRSYPGRKILIGNLPLRLIS
jgi:hypothetical protein